MIRQQQLLMKTEDIDLVFTDEAIEELAAVAAEVNTFPGQKLDLTASYLQVAILHSPLPHLLRDSGH